MSTSSLCIMGIKFSPLPITHLNVASSLARFDPRRPQWRPGSTQRGGWLPRETGSSSHSGFIDHAPHQGHTPVRERKEKRERDRGLKAESGGAAKWYCQCPSWTRNYQPAPFSLSLLTLSFTPRQQASCLKRFYISSVQTFILLCKDVVNPPPPTHVCRYQSFSILCWHSACCM